MPPQAGLAPLIERQSTWTGAQRRVCVQNGAGKSLIELRICLGGIDLTKSDLAVRPCEIENAIGDPQILIFFDQPEAGFASFSRASAVPLGLRSFAASRLRSSRKAS